jgi:Lar family restriction alleviation protein
MGFKVNERIGVGNYLKHTGACEIELAAFNFSTTGGGMMSRTRILCNGCGFPLVYCKCQELRPCPFCKYGDVEKAEGTQPTIDGSAIAYWIICGRCHTEGPVKDTIDEAIKAWNTRTPPMPCSNCGDDLG